MLEEWGAGTFNVDAVALIQQTVLLFCTAL